MRIFAVLLFGLLTLAGCSKPTAEAAEDSKSLPTYFAAPTFSLTDENGHPFGNDQLKGKTWIVTLFYTTCPGPCPMMSGRLKHIQNAVSDPNVLLVSISVDSDHDTPAKMKAYSEAMGADEKRWFFLTGGPAAIQAVADGLKLGYESSAPGQPLVHDTKFLLYDKAGQCRGIYHTTDEADMAKIADDARMLAKY